MQRVSCDRFRGSTRQTSSTNRAAPLAIPCYILQGISLPITDSRRDRPRAKNCSMKFLAAKTPSPAQYSRGRFREIDRGIQFNRHCGDPDISLEENHVVNIDDIRWESVFRTFDDTNIKFHILEVKCEIRWKRNRRKRGIRPNCNRSKIKIFDKIHISIIFLLNYVTRFLPANLYKK